MDWTPLWLSFQLAAITTVVLFVIGVPVAYKLAQTTKVYKPVIEAVISLPIVLPPTVLGFYLLIALSPNSALGHFLESYLGISFLFSFKGLVLASVLYSLPFMVHPLQAGFSQLSEQVYDYGALLPMSGFKKMMRIYLPSIKKSVITGVILTFAHTLGEFGVVLMIGGNLPESTRVVSIAIYDEVEQLNYTQAHIMSAILLVISFAILVTTYAINNSEKYKRIWRF